MSTLFTKIINGDIPSFKVAENDKFFSFLDIRPISPGHTLVIPKIEVDHFFDLPDDYLSEIFVFAKPIVKALEASFKCQRVGSMISGLEIPHAHLHLVPIVDMAKWSFEFAKSADMDDLKTQLETIHSTLKRDYS